MKPVSQSSIQRRSHRAGETRLEVRSTHPVTDYHFHAPAADLRAANDRHRLQLRPSFRDLSREFIAREIKRDYAAEAFFFAIIVGISAWPIVLVFQALAKLAK
jgi:hypothetical protein